MAKTPDYLGSALRVKKWSMGASKALLLDTAFGRMFSRGTIFPDPDAGNKSAGDSITMAFNSNPTTPGVGEGGTLDGNEEVLNYENFTMYINEHRKAFEVAGKKNIERFRNTQDFDLDAYENIVKYFSATTDTSCFQQLAGAYPTTITSEEIDFSGDKRILVTGNNSVDAVNSDRIVRAGAQSDDESLTTSDTFTLDLIDVMLEKARKTPYIAPHADGRYDLYLSPEQCTDLKRDDSGKIQFYEIAKQEIAGGKTNIYNDGRGVQTAIPFGVYDRVNIIMCDRIAYGVNSSTSVAIANVRRAVLTGRNALCFASPIITSRNLSKLKVGGAAPLEVYEMDKDYGHKIGLAATMVCGFKRKKFSNTRDSGVIVCSTYAAPHEQ